MNTRRQKIWLVSMLSLMVVLSAYYLFTDDLDRVDDVPEAQGGDAADADDLDITYNSQFWNGDGLALSEKEILAQVESLQASAAIMDQFESMQYTRDQMLKERFDEIRKIVTDPSQTAEAMTQAYTELSLLEEQYAIIDSLEEQLIREYGNAIILEEDGEWHVRIMAKDLEKSEALSIIETVAKELGVPDRDVYVTIMN